MVLLVAVAVAGCDGVVADSVLVTVCVVEVAVVLEVAEAAVAVLALVVVVGFVWRADSVVVWPSAGAVVEVAVSVGAVGELALAVVLVICVKVFERLLAML